MHIYTGGKHQSCETCGKSFEPSHEKTCLRVFYKVRPKLAFGATEAS